MASECNVVPMSAPNAALTNWCCCTRDLPRKASEVILARQWLSSPARASSSTLASGRAARMGFSISDALMGMGNLRRWSTSLDMARASGCFNARANTESVGDTFKLTERLYCAGGIHLQAAVRRNLVGRNLHLEG